MPYPLSINRPMSWMGSGPRQDSLAPEFGTNTGRQGIFNPDDPQQKASAINRLRELATSYGPRLDMKYTGETGLLPNDAEGYSKMLNARTEAANIGNILGGKAPMGIRYGGTMGPDSDDAQGFGSRKALEALKGYWTNPNVRFS